MAEATLPDTKHSPAPWSYEVHELSTGYSAIVYDARGWGLVDHLSEADARLIAAAPELLRVAELLVDWLDEEPGAHKLCDVALAAIAKARGQA